MDYTGYRVITKEEDIAKFYETGGNCFTDFCENEYLFVGDEVYCYQGGMFRRVGYPVIESSFGGMLKPRNIQQVAAFDMIQDAKTPVKLITGTWGTGKTMILAAAAIKAIESGYFDRIVWVRNNVQVKDTDNLGALPGSELDKILPYAMPLADHCGGVDGLRSLIEARQIDIIPLGFLRGRSIKNSIIMCSEAENLTKEHIQLIMGRVDEGSNLWLDADIKQRDRAAFEKSKGIETMIERLGGHELFGYVHLVKSERSETAALADLLDN